MGTAYISLAMTIGPALALVMVVLFFLIGGIPFGYFAGKLNGVDIRSLGSGNIGATNVFRTLGKKWGITVFLLDFLKAFLPPFILKHLMASGALVPDQVPADLLLILAGMSLILGHNFSPYLGFKGGKGMASSAGFLFAILPISGFCCVAVWMIVFFLSRYVSLASIMAAAALPVSSFFFYRESMWLVGLSLFLGVMAIWRHRSNVQRLMNGTEMRFTRKKKGQDT